MIKLQNLKELSLNGYSVCYMEDVYLRQIYWVKGKEKRAEFLCPKDNNIRVIL